MGRAKTKKKIASKLTSKVENRIVELSLQNPDFGARRLASFLKQEKISVSASQIYNIQKRHDLSNRAKRLAKLKEKGAKAAPVLKKPPTKITSEVEERIVQISLKHPDLGASRLAPLLENEEILVTASAIYRVLKRHGLQNRSMRKLRLEAQQAFEAIPQPAAEKTASQAIAIPIPVEEPEPLVEVIEKGLPAGRVLPTSTIPHQIKARSPWFLTLCNILLLLLLLFLGFYTWQNISIARLEPETLAAITASPVSTTAEPEVAAPILDDYRLIWERNLFNLSKEEAPAPKKEIEVEKLALAEKDLGLKLVGTVVADDPRLSRAFIDNRSTREQEVYREGDRANEVLIKKVFRNKVVITTDDGDQLLTVDIEESSSRSKTPSYSQQITGSYTAPSQIPGSTFPRARSASISINRQEVEAALADRDQLLQQMTISPYLEGDQPGGFRIGSIPPQSALRKMGLRSRDVIVGVNEDDITSPEQAAEFLQKLAEGGEVTIKLKRRRRTRQIKLNIE